MTRPRNDTRPGYITMVGNVSHAPDPTDQYRTTYCGRMAGRVRPAAIHQIRCDDCRMMATRVADEHEMGDTTP